MSRAYARSHSGLGRTPRPALSRDRHRGSSPGLGAHSRPIAQAGARGLDEATHIIFLIDGRTEITAPTAISPSCCASWASRSPWRSTRSTATAREAWRRFYTLGFSDQFSIPPSTAWGSRLLDHVTAGFAQAAPARTRRADDHKVAIIAGERGQIHSSERAGWGGARHRLFCGRHHARRRGRDSRDRRRPLRVCGYRGIRRKGRPS